LAVENTFRPFSEKFLRRLLARLAGEESYVFLESNSPIGGNRFSHLFVEPRERLTLLGNEEPEGFFAGIEERLRQGYFLAGWFAYEFGYLLDPVLRPLARGCVDEELACLWCCERALVHDHCTTVPSPLEAWLEGQEAVEDPGFSYAVEGLKVAEERRDYIENIQRIKEYIAAGDTYQVNYTTALRFDFAGSPEGLYLALRRNQSVAYGALIKNGGRHVLSLSPELFFRITGDRITVRPMKGTVRRGILPTEDEKLKDFLRSDIKNRSENVMIVDLLRNDLGRVCERPSVQTRSLFDVETYETLHQMTSTVEGRLRGGFSWQELFTALFPSGSVTGAPKIRTMEIIRQLEAAPRGVYTGAIGFIGAAGAAFNVPIRTVSIEGTKGSMGIGSGIVYDSDAEQEWQECLLKGRFLSAPLAPFQLIETLYWEPGTGFWLEREHLARLQDSARRLQFFCDPQEAAQALRHEVARHTASGQEGGRRVRLLLSKDGSLAVNSAACPAPARQLLPPLVEQGDLPPVCLASQAVDSRSPELYHKTTRRALYDAERQQALARGFWEVLFVNERGEITEGSITNIFVRTEDCFLTPPLSSGLLDGVFRRFFIDNCPLAVRERILRPRDLLDAAAVYVGNSVRGLVQVGVEAISPDNS